MNIENITDASQQNGRNLNEINKAQAKVLFLVKTVRREFNLGLRTPKIHFGINYDRLAVQPVIHDNNTLYGYIRNLKLELEKNPNNHCENENVTLMALNIFGKLVKDSRSHIRSFYMLQSPVATNLLDLELGFDFSRVTDHSVRIAFINKVFELLLNPISCKADLYKIDTKEKLFEFYNNYLQFIFKPEIAKLGLSDNLFQNGLTDFTNLFIYLVGCDYLDLNIDKDISKVVEAKQSGESNVILFTKLKGSNSSQA